METGAPVVVYKAWCKRFFHLPTWDRVASDVSAKGAFWRRHQDLKKLFVDSGFKADKYIQFRAPNYGTWPDKVFEAVVRGEVTPPEINNGSAWFSFGAWK